MPVHNAERFLSEAIDSVLQQTFTDFEFIIIDDGSTDGSAAIINSYTDPRLRFYQNETNLSISPTLNKGIALASTDLIARMDGDDICHPERLQKQYSYMAANPDCAMVTCRARVITEEGQLVQQDDFKSDYYYYNSIFESWIYHPTVVFRKAAVEHCGGYTVPHSEDFKLFSQLYKRFKIHTLSEILLDYRVNSQSLHQVQKKKEYEQAHLEQILQNLKYYAGSDFTIPAAYIECYRHNFTPLLEKGSIDSIADCLRVLHFLTERILETPNPNREPAAIVKAAFYKRRFILSYFLQYLPLLKALQLAAKTNSWALAKRVFKSRIKRGLL
jgi:glycosyltransferase involved in cell wall biosynthesis